MKLFGSYTSPFVRHCRIALLETQQAFEFVETDQAASAAQSPTQRVPFLQDGDKFFTDSASILKYLREKTGGSFCPTPEELDQLCLVNTVLDSLVNLFFLERDGVQVNEVAYLQRQAARIQSTLAELDQLALPESAPYNDAQLRLACMMGWAKFRKRADFSPYANLEKFYAGALNYGPFATTQPPQA